MEVMWSIFILASVIVCLDYSAVAQVCKISNIQIDSEDGRQQYIELNLKKVDVDDEGSCPGCNLSEDSKAGAYLYSQWTATPPTFKIVFTPRELIEECGELKCLVSHIAKQCDFIHCLHFDSQSHDHEDRTDFPC